MPANSLILAAFCALPLSAPPVSPELSIGFVGADVEFRVEHGNQIFLGGIIASLSPQMTHYLTALPPLLSNHVLLGAGVGYPDGGFAVQFTQSQLPAGVERIGSSMCGRRHGVSISPSISPSQEISNRPRDAVAGHDLRSVGSGSEGVSLDVELLRQ